MEHNCSECIFCDSASYAYPCRECIIEGNWEYFITKRTALSLPWNYSTIFSESIGIKKMILNPPATILIFDDGTKSVVKCMEGEEYDAEKGVALSLLKKVLGEKKYKKLLKDTNKKFVESVSNKED